MNQLISNTDPLLHRASQLVTDEYLKNNQKELKAIASTLVNAIYQHSALGVSACQLGIDTAMFAINVDNQLRVCINPQIVAAAVQMEKQSEGCLSYPGLRLMVNRPDAVAVRYYNIDGVEVTEHLEGLTARAWLHEYDHTMGICFIDRVSKLSQHMAQKRLIKLNKKGKR